MNNLLQEAIKKVEFLSESEQETIALFIIEQVNNIKKKQSKGVLYKLKNIKIQAHENFAENKNILG
ncbi:hypothetical protein NIES204_08310 [Planktothrix agardhii NIES-204]|jgi:hypothetical protein|nr:hypothetical protein NIES204_08310 [Planktothrix agardhii NIES-204]